LIQKPAPERAFGRKAGQDRILAGSACITLHNYVIEFTGFA